jgi:hypothetical protein
MNLEPMLAKSFTPTHAIPRSGDGFLHGVVEVSRVKFPAARVGR